MPMTRHEMAGLIFALKTYDPSQPLYISKQVKQAYDAVDAFEKHSKEFRLEQIQKNVSQFEQMLANLAGPERIKAIKELRSATGLGLKESKEAVEELVATGRLPAQIAEYLCDKEAEQRVYSIELAPTAQFDQMPQEAVRRPMLMVSMSSAVAPPGTFGPDGHIVE